MQNLIESYKRQYKNALLTLERLENQKEQINHKLKLDPVSTYLLKDLRDINLDIKITVNEIEHVESYLNPNEVEI